MSAAVPADAVESRGWLLRERDFDLVDTGRRESRFAQGNGYLGFRAATEERHVDEHRLFGVAGLFDRAAGELEVTEAPNLPDVLAVDITLDGERFALDRGRVERYDLTLDLRTGEVRRDIGWISPGGDRVSIGFRRIASLHDPHLVASQVEITAYQSTTARIRSGIDGEHANRGVQHLTERLSAVTGDRARLDGRTIESGVDTFVAVDHCVQLDGHIVSLESSGRIGRCSAHVEWCPDLEPGQTLTIEKFATVHTQRDWDWDHGRDAADAKVQPSSSLDDAKARGYDACLDESAARWNEFWNRHDIVIESDDPRDQFAVRYSLFHLRAMTHVYDDRVGISAKGFTGDGYKGHSFWDTEVYILPMWQLTAPEVADNLLRYRVRLLDSARRLAAERGFAGAMFPWESAWPTDGEVTPTRGNIDALTGERDVIRTGLLQHHITAVIAHAFARHATVGGRDVADDADGRTVIIEAARFWCSRLDVAPDGLHLLNSIGPDEYKEHVDDNAFTMYLAHWCLVEAARIVTSIGTNPEGGPEVRPDEPTAWADAAARMALPIANEDGLVPQDATYLDLPDLPELAELKSAAVPFGVIRQYSLDDLSGFQVSKQADLVVLFHLLPDAFDEATQRRNLRFYESKTLHDSSLSAAMYCLEATRLGEHEIARQLWPRARDVDLGAAADCAGGLHAAAMGGLWQVVVHGFAGLDIDRAGNLSVVPRLPPGWTHVGFDIVYRGTPLHFHIGACERFVTGPPGQTDIVLNGVSMTVGETPTRF